MTKRILRCFAWFLGGFVAGWALVQSLLSILY